MSNDGPNESRVGKYKSNRWNDGAQADPGYLVDRRQGSCIPARGPRVVSILVVLLEGAEAPSAPSAPSAPTVLKEMPCRASQTRRYVVDRWKVVSRGDAAAQAKQALKKLNTLTAWTNTSKQANRDTDEHLRVPSM